MNIQFIPDTEYAEQVLTPPVPAKKVIPDWYKQMPFLLEGHEAYGLTESNATTATMKSCNPFLDALTSGYVCCLQTDLEILRQPNGSYSFQWRTEEEVVTDHTKCQHPTLPIAFNGTDSVYKFHNDFVIKTPKGYSTQFMHPVNRHDLPFRVFSGIVDTDTYGQAVHFPFQMMDTQKSSIIIEKGTPICQFIPFKRESWKSEVHKFNFDQKIRRAHHYFSKIYRAYKTLHWVRKKFD